MDGQMPVGYLIDEAATYYSDGYLMLDEKPGTILVRSSASSNSKGTGDDRSVPLRYIHIGSLWYDYGGT